MTKDSRLPRRIAGLLNARLPELGLEHLPDPRHRRGRRWKSLATLVRAALLTLMAAGKSAREAECLTAEMSLPMRRLLGIPRRVPDTTLRTALSQIAPDDLRRCVVRQARAAHRRKALAPLGVPFGLLAIDGKCTAIGAWDERYSQRQVHSAGPGASGIARTMTCTLVSSRAKVCLDANPVPPATNEMGHFPRVLAELKAAYHGLELFRLITADAGMCSERNARLVVEQHQLDYLFRLKVDQPTLFAEAKRMLGRNTAGEAPWVTVDIRGREEVTRRVFLTSELAGYPGWDHLQTLVRVQVEKRDIHTGQIIEQKDDDKERYYISSLAQDTLTPAQWLLVVRLHWSVENQCHNTWDKIFREDEHPWFESGEEAPQGAVVVMLLRRLAYNMLALFRQVTQRSEDRRQTPWKDVLRSVYRTLIAATDNDLCALRHRALSDA